MKAVVTGMIATYPVPGMVWDYIQYVIGIINLGFEVVYLEDTGLASYHPDPTQYLSDCLNQLTSHKPIRWHYRAPDGTTAGITAEELRLAIAKSDVFINVSGGTLFRDEYMPCSTKVLIDTDPGLNQLVNYPKWDRIPDMKELTDIEVMSISLPMLLVLEKQLAWYQHWVSNGRLHFHPSLSNIGLQKVKGLCGPQL